MQLISECAARLTLILYVRPILLKFNIAAISLSRPVKQYTNWPAVGLLINVKPLIEEHNLRRKGAKDRPE